MQTFTLKCICYILTINLLRVLKQPLLLGLVKPIHHLMYESIHFYAVHMFAIIYSACTTESLCLQKHYIGSLPKRPYNRCKAFNFNCYVCRKTTSSDTLNFISCFHDSFNLFFPLPKPCISICSATLVSYSG
jgi:hypothetical protein